MPRPTKDPKARQSEQTAIRLTTETLERADALIAHVARMSGRSTTRTDVLREAIAQGLRQLELERAAGGGGRRRAV